MFCVWLCLFAAMLSLRLSENIPGEDSGTNLPEGLAQEKKEPAAEAPAADSAGTAGGTDENSSYVSPLIRVLLTDSEQKGYMHEQVAVSSESAIHLAGSGVTIPPGQTEVITAADGRFMDGKIVLETESPDAGIAVESISRARGVPVYEGTLEIHKTEQGLYLVNELDLETYLKYVVPSEMPASYSQEALKAQAVCARTYAVRAMENYALEEYQAQVDDSVSYQVYNNLDRQENTDLAVDSTAGQIMTFEGEPITAYFFSTSCGYTSTDEVWSGEGGEAYLKSVYVGSDSPENVQSEEVFASFIQSADASDYESEDGWYRWSVEIPAEVLDQRLEAYGIGGIQDMAVLSRSSGGAVTALEITGTGGSAVLENEYRIREFLSVEGIPVTKNDGSVTEKMNLLPSAYFICSGVFENGKTEGFLLLGGGYGHGVGMSQNGARHLAEQGYGWREILNYFYQNITLEQIE